MERKGKKGKVGCAVFSGGVAFEGACVTKTVTCGLFTPRKLPAWGKGEKEEWRRKGKTTGRGEGIVLQIGGSLHEKQNPGS